MPVPRHESKPALSNKFEAHFGNGIRSFGAPFLKSGVGNIRRHDTAWRGFTVVLLLAIFATGCSTHGEVCRDERPFRERAQQQHGNGLLVEAAALSRTESESVFGVPLNDINVQPVWLKITSFREDPQWLFPNAIDRDYFPTFEVARRASKVSTFSVHELYERLNQDRIDPFIPPRMTTSGFIFAHSDEGMKALNVDLHSPRGSETFSFVVPVPGLPTTYFAVSNESVDQEFETEGLDGQGLHSWLRQLECCVADAEGRPGDPLNVAFVGSLEKLRTALIAQHWDVTAPVTSASLRRMVSAFLFGSRYRYAPISSLYLFGREQDLAFQKSRAIIDERNHMRIWLAPVTLEGEPVWVGQVSRDIGVKLSGKLWPPTTHVIDPDVDDARFYVLQDLLTGERIERLGFVKGHQEATMSAPHFNAENDPYFTDGLRAVFFLSDGHVVPSEMELLDWSLPPALEPYRSFYVMPHSSAVRPKE